MKKNLKNKRFKNHKKNNNKIKNLTYENSFNRD